MRTLAQSGSLLVPVENGTFVLPPTKVFDPRNYGILGNADDSPPYQAAVTALVAAGGSGSILVPQTSTFTQTIDVSGATSVTFLGSSPARTIGTDQPSTMRFTGTAGGSATGSFIKAPGVNLAIVNVSVKYNNAGFVGRLIDLTGGTGYFSGCLIRPDGVLTGHKALVYLDQATLVTLNNCMLFGDRSLFGKANNGSFSNVVNMEFGYCQGISVEPVWNPGQAWNFYGVTFEPIFNGGAITPGAVNHDAGVLAQALNFDGCHFGDAGAIGAWITFAGYGCNVRGGFYNTIAGGSLIAANGISDGGISVSGGEFFAVAGSFLIDLSAATTPKPITIEAIAYFNNVLPTSLVNGTIPGGSRVTLPNGVMTFYADVNQLAIETISDASGRVLESDFNVGESQPRFQRKSNGAMVWGDGTGTPTETLARAATGELGAYSASLATMSAGFGMRVAEGANCKQGTAVLVGGTVVVTNTAVTANSRIFVTVQALGTVAVPQAMGVTARTADTSFTITSASVTDTSTVAYEIFEPA